MNKVIWYYSIMAKNDGYIELYKKYRPRTWDEVVGQDLVINDLQTAVAEDRIPTAYLFSGPRGCGKTTVAKILAKAINCENPDGKGNPCGKCSVCKSIDNDSCMGVHYISAANLANGATDIREIMDQAHRMSPIKKPIWIIDEVHRLSPQAFDALLIPLEDTSMPSLFIFCTTEIRKVPTTVTSRVQSRAFHLVDSLTLTQLCNELLRREGYEKVDQSVYREYMREDKAKPFNKRRKVYSSELIAKAIKQAGATVDGGSVRQTLSTLDHLLVNPDDEEKNWDSIIAGSLFLKRNAGKALADISAAIKAGDDPRDLINSLVATTREMVLLLHMPEDKVDKSQAKRRRVAQAYGDHVLLKCFTILGESQRDMQTTDDSRVYLEIAAIKIAGLLSKAVPAQK